MISSCSNSGTSSSSEAAAVSELDKELAFVVKNIVIKTEFDSTKKTWKASLTWQVVNGATFDLDYGTTKGGSYSTNLKGVVSPLVIDNLEAGTTQYFVLIINKIVDNVPVTVRSSEFSVILPLDAYKEKPAPFAMSTIPSDGQVEIKWLPAERAVFYLIQRGTSSGSYPTVVKNLATSPYIDKDLTNGAKLYYMVIAVNSAGSTNASEESSATPLAAPGNFSLTAVAGNGLIILNWGSSSTATSYNVLRSTSESSGFTLLNTTPLPMGTLTYNDNTASNGTVYYYKISAINPTNSATESNTANAKPGPAPGVFSFNADPVAGNEQVTLSWSASANAESYTVQYSTTDGAFSSTISSSAISPFTVTGLSNGTLYYFRIIAVNAIGSKNISEDTEATPSASGASPLRWVQQLGAEGTSAGSSFDTAIDSAGNIIVVGYTDTRLDPPHQWAYQLGVMIKYDTNGNFIWKREVPSNLANHHSIVRSVVTDAASNIYIQGSLLGFAPAYGDYSFLAKFNSDGEEQWFQSNSEGYLDGYSFRGVYGSSLVIDSDGSLYVAGSTSVSLDGHTQAGFTDMFLAKYSPSDGSRLWSTQLGVDSSFASPYPTSSMTQAVDLVIDSSSNIYVTGTFSGATIGLDGNARDPDSPDSFLAKYSTSSGSALLTWLKVAPGTSQAVTLDAASNVYITGVTEQGLHGNSQIGVKDVFVSKYDVSNGNREWTKQIGATDGYLDGGSTVFDASGNFYVSGNTDKDLNGTTLSGLSDVFVIKYNNIGNAMWTRLLGNVGTRSVYIDGGESGPGYWEDQTFGNVSVYSNKIILDGSGYYYISGTTDIGLGTSTQSGAWDLFLAKYSATP